MNPTVLPESGRQSLEQHSLPGQSVEQHQRVKGTLTSENSQSKVSIEMKRVAKAAFKTGKGGEVEGSSSIRQQGKVSGKCLLLNVFYRYT